MRIRTLILALTAMSATADTQDRFDINAMVPENNLIDRDITMQRPRNFTPTSVNNQRHTIEDMEKMMNDKLARSGRKLAQDDKEIDHVILEA